MSGNVNTYPKTVNLESSIPVNSQMKRVVKSNCSNGSTPTCIKKSYNIPISGAQRNNVNWGTINGKTCVGPKITFHRGGIGATACITHYNGVSVHASGANPVPGYCQISVNATAGGKWQYYNGTHGGPVYQKTKLKHAGTCSNDSCQYLNAYFSLAGGSAQMSFTAVC
jgi:hypothetical protein